jgi:hypothetical protein
VFGEPPLRFDVNLAFEVQEDKRDSKQWSEECLDEAEAKADEVKCLRL